MVWFLTFTIVWINASKTHCRRRWHFNLEMPATTHTDRTPSQGESRLGSNEESQGRYSRQCVALPCQSWCTHYSNSLTLQRMNSSKWNSKQTGETKSECTGTCTYRWTGERTREWTVNAPMTAVFNKPPPWNEPLNALVNDPSNKPEKQTIECNSEQKSERTRE